MRTPSVWVTSFPHFMLLWVGLWSAPLVGFFLLSMYSHRILTFAGGAIVVAAGLVGGLVVAVLMWFTVALPLQNKLKRGAGDGG
jgi:hypothetical protein